MHFSKLKVRRDIHKVVCMNGLALYQMLKVEAKYPSFLVNALKQKTCCA